jgi:hypothetical protein
MDEEKNGLGGGGRRRGVPPAKEHVRSLKFQHARIITERGCPAEAGIRRRLSGILERARLSLYDKGNLRIRRLGGQSQQNI